MDFDFSEEQRLLKESVDRLIGDRYDFEQRKTFAQGDSGWSREIWEQYRRARPARPCPFAEEHGGFGGGPVETMIVMEAFGRAPCRSSRISRLSCWAAAFLRHGGSDEQKRRASSPRSPTASLKLAFAHAETAIALRSRRRRNARREERLRLRARRREERRAQRRHRRQADRHRARRRRAGAIATASALFLVDGKGQGGVAARLSDPGRTARRGNIAVAACESAPRACSASRDALPIIERVVDEAIAALVRRGRRRHGGNARAHRRISEDAQAIRRRDRQLSRSCSTAPSTC